MTSRVGADLAFVRDAAAAVAARAEGRMVIVPEALEWRPRVGAPLVPSNVCRELMAFAHRHRAESVVSDVHYRETLREHSSAAGLALLDAPADTFEPYAFTKMLLCEGRLRFLPCEGDTMSRLREQILSTKAKPGEGGSWKVLHRRSMGSHGDIAAACVIAVWSLRHEVSDADPNVRANGSRMTRRVEFSWDRWDTEADDAGTEGGDRRF